MSRQNLFKQAQGLFHQRRYSHAESILLSLYKEKTEIAVSGALFNLYLTIGKIKEASSYIPDLLFSYQQDLSLCEQASQIYLQLEKQDLALKCYEDFVKRNPVNAEGYFNYAYLLKSLSFYDKAEVYYNKALDNNISGAEEVYSNLSLIYTEQHKDKEAIKALEKALAINPTYTPALFNRAARFEDVGDMMNAEVYFKKALQVDPKHYLALSRLANVRKYEDLNNPVVKNIKAVIKSNALDPIDKCDLGFALGKVLNDCGAYDEAFKAYEDANGLMHQVGQYDPSEQNSNITNLIDTFSQEYFNTIAKVNEASPIFICGMFRSGSTLVEQILSAHSKVTAGGELEFFVRLMETGRLQKWQGQGPGQWPEQWPEQWKGMSADARGKIALDYMEHLTTLFPKAEVITDKRPDNILYVGVIKSLFPNAKIITSKRNPLDNCLSVFFLQLAKSMPYATDLKNIGHYYKEQQRLNDHWKKLFPDTVYEMDYDELVSNPQEGIEGVLDFCGLDFDKGCLAFHKNTNSVQTASAWQVRQPLYNKSSGRWVNYKKHLAGLIELFPIK